MRYFEISSGLRMPVFSEEMDMINLCGNKLTSEEDFDERQKQLATDMVSRGLLRRITNDDKVFYETDRMDLWRF